MKYTFGTLFTTLRELTEPTAAWSRHHAERMIYDPGKARYVVTTHINPMSPLKVVNIEKGSLPIVLRCIGFGLHFCRLDK